MSWSRYVLISLTLCCTALVNHAQQQYPKTLLWRITGKGLTAPSYLFGTMHLNDQRLFNFGDSVYSAIERTSGLAIEVNPDELCAYYVNQLFDELQDRKTLEDILDKDDYKRYGPALAKKFDKDVEEITTRDIVKEKNKWMEELMEKGEMPTFVDAYLFNIARRQGKWLGGIEDITDQTGLLEDLVDKSDIVYLLAGDSAMEKENHFALDQLIDIYINQDLNRLEEQYNHPSYAEEKDLLLIRRNVKMARRIDSLTALRTMFLAIGAAHLPGDSGVIQLLQKRGFTVEPVFSSRKIAAKDYKFKEVQLPWVLVKDEQNLYSAEMPANPASIKLYGVMEMKFLFDIFNMSGFCTMAVVNPASMPNKDSMRVELAQRMYPDKNAKPPVDISKGDIKGKEFFVKSEGGHIRMQIFSRNKVIYIAMMASVKKESINSADAEKFFKSFAINKTESSASNMRVFTDSIMGLTLRTPSAIAYNKQFSSTDEELYKVSTFAGADPSSGLYIMLFTREVKPGYQMRNDSVMFADMIANMGEQFINGQTKERDIEGRRALEFSGGNKAQADLHSRALTVMRDGRFFMLMALGDSTQVMGNVVDEMYSSLHFTSPPSLTWGKYETPDSAVTTWAPGPIIHWEEYYQDRMIAYDTATATTYFIMPDSIGKYSWVSSDSALYSLNKTVEPGQILLYEKNVMNGGIPGKEFMKKEGSIYNRTRVLPNGDVVYRILVEGGKELVESENANKFFENFHLKSGKLPATYLISKAKLLLQNLSAADTATREEAYTALYLAPFVKSELPMLHEAFLKTYEAPTEYWEGIAINERIAQKIVALEDPSSLVFLEEQYKKPGKENDQMKGVIVNALAKMGTRQSFELMTQLLSSYIPDHDPGYNFIASLMDKPKLTAEIYPALQPILAKHEYYGRALADVAVQLIDSGAISKAKVMEAEKDFVQMGATWVEKIKQYDSLQYYSWTVLAIMHTLNTPASNAVLKDFLQIKNNYLRKGAIIYLLQNNQKVPAWALDSVASDKESRTSFYSELKENNKQSLFPKKYLNQVSFAEGDIYDMSDDEARIESMKFLKVVKATYKGKQYNFYLYKVGYNYESDTSSYYLAISGAWDLKRKKIEKEEDLSGFFYESEFDAARIEEFLEAYLKNIEEAEGGED